MSNIVDFPRREPPPEGYSEAYVEKLHAEAFRDLESDLRDSVKMAEITGTFDVQRKQDRGLHFSVVHLMEMLQRLEKGYDARWHGARRPR